MSQANLPISEPFQTKGLKRREIARMQKWPDLRFCEVSLYPVGKSRTPQFEEYMDGNEDYVLLARGDEEPTAYLKKGESSQYIGRSMALLGEPKEVWTQKQRDWQDLDERSRTQEHTDERGMKITQEAGETVNTQSYIEQSGQKS